jgi:hypothetical protein
MVLMESITRGDKMLHSAKELIGGLDTFPSCIKADLNHYFSKGEVLSEDMLIFQLYSDKEAIPILFICNYKKQELKDIKHMFVFGFFGNYSSNNDFFEMELSIKFNCTGWPIEIVKINSGKEKRLGRGTLGIHFLEDYIIPSINAIIGKVSPGSNIAYIYGISADLSDDTDALSRAKFYCRNGFALRNGHFYKYFNYSGKGEKIS